jgi:hypothetical protein
MPVREVPDIFRDYPARPLAERIAGDGMLDAANIGAAANSVKLDPEAWNSWASADASVRRGRCHGDLLLRLTNQNYDLLAIHRDHSTLQDS